MKKLLVNKFSTQKLNAFLKDNHGFTLIEIIFTIIFASIALFATMTMMSTSMLGSMNVEFMNTAANLANVKMESLFSDKKTRGYGYIQESNYPYETNVD
ncbi:type II secretion system protein, partial [candidate division KSB1 bacterium]|nr:type II secretion system protein [candidate division KSB1 bacterium]